MSTVKGTTASRNITTVLWFLVAAATFLAWGYYREQQAKADQAAYLQEIDQKTKAVCSKFDLSQGLCAKY